MIHQQKYVKELQKKYGMEDPKTHSTPIPTATKLDLDLNGRRINKTVYRGMNDSLLCFTSSRPDILHSVCLCAKFQSYPKESHFKDVKRIL